MALIKAAVRREGLRLAQGDPEYTARTLAALGDALPEHVAQELAPLVSLLAPVNTEIAAAAARLEAAARGHPVVERLRTAPGVGPVTALAFVAALADVTRFASAHQVAAYLGLIPGEHSSGERQPRGRITKRGAARMRWLLVEAAWRVLRSPHPDAAALKAWAERIAIRRGKRIAVVALARRLAGSLFALWRDDSTFQASPPRRPAAPRGAGGPRRLPVLCQVGR